MTARHEPAHDGWWRLLVAMAVTGSDGLAWLGSLPRARRALVVRP
jgi:hypothetical protein